ncbi:MAG: dUTP diphosphatase, partial [Desulfobacterales bacterium]|nr:dUTP diphosphatase [Desulfobacterales bacterium]
MHGIPVKITRLKGNKDLSLPEYESEGSSGMDIRASVKEPVLLKPGEIRLIPTGLSVSVPPGYEAQMRPRSGLALHNGIGMVNSPGTIDSDYRGE